jgi:ATP adenylyltransferase
VEVSHSRSESQRRSMESIAEGGYCPFCPEHFRREHKQPIWQQGDYWYLTPSRWPYGDGKLRIHLMAIAIQHVEKVSELPRAARYELMDHCAWAEEAYGIESGALLCRFGEIGYNGTSVDHLHAHITEGDFHNPNFDTIRFKVATLPKS